MKQNMGKDPSLEEMKKRLSETDAKAAALAEEDRQAQENLRQAQEAAAAFERKKAARLQKAEAPSAAASEPGNPALLKNKTAEAIAAPIPTPEAEPVKNPEPKKSKGFIRQINEEIAAQNKKERDDKKSTVEPAPSKELPISIVDALDRERRAPLTPEETSIAQTRKQYFATRKQAGEKSNADVSLELQRREAEYQAIKNQIVKEFLNKGEKEKAQEFLRREVELKRENDAKGSGWEKMKRGVLKGISWFETIGKDPNDSALVKHLKSAGKLAASVAMIGAASALIAPLLGLGSVVAISGGIATYAGQKALMAVAMSNAISILPPKLRVYAGPVLLAVSAYSSPAILAAGVVGLGTSKLSALATKKWLSEKISEQKKEALNKTEIDLSTLEASLEQYEVEYEKIIKSAENKKIYRGILAGATALTAGIATIHFMSPHHDNPVTREHASAAPTSAPEAALPHATPSSSGPDISPQISPAVHPPAPAPESAAHTPSVHNPAQPSTQDTATPSTTHGTELKSDHTQSAPATETTAISERIALKGDAVVHHGEGIEHTVRRQIEANPEWTKEHLGYKGDIHDAKALHEFSGPVAHKITMEHGHVDKITGEEIRVSRPDEVAYKLYSTKDGKIEIDELRVKDNFAFETHKNEPGFEGDAKDSYEYKYSPHVKAVVDNKNNLTEPTPANPEPTTLTEKIPTTTDTATLTPTDSLKTPAAEIHHPRYTPAELAAHDEAVARARATVEEKSNYPQRQTLRTGEAMQTGTTIRTGTGEIIAGGQDQGPVNSYYDNGSRAAIQANKNGGRFDKVYYYDGQHHFTDISPAHNSILNADPGFSHNYFHLSRKEMWEAYTAHQHNLRHTLPHDTKEVWDGLRESKAYEIMQMDQSTAEEGLPRFIQYINELKDATGLKPYTRNIFHWKNETTEEYVTRALQKLEAEGELSKFNAHIK